MMFILLLGIMLMMESTLLFVSSACYGSENRLAYCAYVQQNCNYL